MSTTAEYKEVPAGNFEVFKNMGINCGRIIKRFIKTMTTLSKKPCESIAAASENAAEAKAIYRLLGNPKLTEEVVMATQRKDTLQRIKASGETIILSVQDTSELNYTSHKKTKGLGDGNHANTQGLYVHSNIAFTTEGIPLGMLDQEIWARDPEQRGKRKANRPIEEKESNKWLKSMEKSKQGFPKGIQLVHMADREADFFEFFDKAIETEQDYVIRAVQNRVTDQNGQLLFDLVQQEPAAGQYKVNIPRDTRRNLKAREVTLEIRFLQSHIRVPQQLEKKLGKNSYIEYYIINAKEIDPLPGIEPIEWFLVTNIPITTADEAMEKVGWYVQRWKIERFHYILKSGCEVEELQERDAEPLKKLILMYSIIAIQILSITYLARETPDASCEEILEEQEWKVLYRIVNKTSNLPTTVPTIKEAVAYLAKLGGFLGRKGDGDPGVKVIWKGLKELRIVTKHYKYLLE